ncbi:Glyoxalase/Bleomycin resistance protein/Dihydroxybiphenyl dioxygenase [Glarea lozoyensis ATCC 20868]|uniref:Glyoxalase/Bleomycin resistance protein/Dihydroxybiphenyl dioxygenase n=1 Tax=Glarea lozoyensis (strain ATCC 20868 / MF5171) TaxID=1116229 RepID=S3CQ58_GLAL2|nr:Glyoxalase/Bleomycin resistance protein/Dihydroxybiphenyl dioxygenase [Glarea lozoyensis ATCC 20868]EPE28622.1 Glyoxalase/Bleomycin resistance protein/Dihydroxybiphenyl dioxygenase [Glarea lozoyensis ATCC 20868]
MNLNQITLPSTSIPTSIIFYRTLGLQLIVHTSDDYARFIAGTSTFSLHRVDAVTNGAWVYFEVADVDKTVAELEAKGITITERPEDKSWLWREARVSDPDGNVVIIYHAGEMRENPPWRLEDGKK